MISHSYLNTVKKIIQSYDGSSPLAVWLKQFFKAGKKFGSKDRKEITHACYCYYRLGNAFQNSDVEEKILTALFLCSSSSNKILQELKPEWIEKISFSLSEKIRFLSALDEVKKIFPFQNELSKETDIKSFNCSFLIQPDLYLRIRPGNKESVVQKLGGASIDFTILEDECIRLSNQLKLDEILNLDEEVVVQDYNSQKVFNGLHNSKLQTPNSKLSVWDCCAASGGKSILSYDTFPHVQLTVSDVRKTILINLQKRFQRAGIKNYKSFVADLTKYPFSISHSPFDIVICDVPCSGSGTWSRTPEQLFFFKEEKIEYYSNLQKKIVSNASEALNKNGNLLYITCSVFEKENEDVVQFIEKNLPLQLIEMRYLKGYEKKADSLFVALFTAL